MTGGADIWRAFGTPEWGLLALSLAGALFYLASGERVYRGRALVKGAAVGVLALLVAWLLASGMLAGPDVWLLVTALALSTIGDVFLVGESERHFRAGLVSFLLAHVVYGAIFVGHVEAPWWPGFGATVAAAGVVLAAAMVLAWLWPVLGSLRGPVAAYVAVIVTMALAALLADFDTPWVALGAVAFVASDAALAANRFRGPLPGAGTFVWSSYCAAQGLLAFGVLAG
ncbi:MAG: lysoplasmalogenase [Alphaproteobacteria bacterium]|jgi:uncharacterized membrane protein YhhN|nr:lysoplasmalogenase [Alphaproteobacteria bacterium]MDP6623508.1 lysoplasmalogenase [Alphaproteobacteria bacterium]|tara:strand:+ start:3554 stop:4237 length:684 start_codon:yes stop_codon:yes gene_type:complete